MMAFEVRAGSELRHEPSGELLARERLSEDDINLCTLLYI